MWKIIIGFIIFAALAMFVIMKGGDKLDMGGEKHGEDPTHAPAAAPAASTPAPAPAPAAVPAEPAASVAK